MKKRTLSAPILRSMMGIAPGIMVLAPVALAQPAAQPAMPDTAIVTAVRGPMITLSAGSNMGARAGAIYQIARDNAVVRLQLVEVRPNESSARIVAADTGEQSLTITVGDSATFLGMAAETVPLPPAPATPPLPPAPQQPTTPLPPQQPTPQTPVSTNGASPATVLVTSVAGQDVTLGAGANGGVALGAVYEMPVVGNAQARMIVVEINANSSRARLLEIKDGFVPVVGEEARFVNVEPVPAELLAPVAPVTITPTQPTVLVPDQTPLLPTKPGGSGLQMQMTPVSEISGRAATITAVNGQSVTLNAGILQGATIGQNVPILRAGAVIGLVRIESAAPNSSVAAIVYSDATAGVLRVGDAAGLIATSSGVRAPIILPAIGVPNAPIPSVRVKFESGASNVEVPKADATYELLASLATSGLIKSQPPRVFQDDGARRHRVAEDINFSRAQIAGFVTEALSNFDGEKGRSAAALAILVKQYRRDLQDLNVPAATLDAFKEGGFQLGVSSWTRLTAVGGDTGNNARDANDERFGALRRKTGLDTRTNVFGTISPKLSFYASLDAGTDVRNGEPFGQVASSSFRKAYVDYDANSLLRGLNLRLGRQEYWMGPGHFGTGILSDASGGLDSLSSSFKRGSYELRGIYARLGRGPAGSPRSLYVQDINVRIGKDAKIGINTAVLSPNDNFNATNFLTAFSPLPLYLIRKDKTSNNSSATNSNAIVSAYGELGVAAGVRVYGETILDDLGTNNRNPIENRAGSIFGIKLNDPKDPAKRGLNFEYARFSSVAYTYFANRPGFTDDYSYYYRGAPLGYSIAPLAPTVYGGAENLRADFYYRVIPKLTLFGSAQFADINAQDQNTPGIAGYQRQRVLRAAAAYDLSRRFTLTARYQHVETDQPNFVTGSGTLKNSLFSLELGRSF